QADCCGLAENGIRLWHGCNRCRSVGSTMGSRYGAAVAFPLGPQPEFLVVMLRRLFFALLLLPAWVPAVRSAEYPTRPVTLVVAFTPGGPSDVLARIVGRKLEQIFGQPFIIENRPAAGGNVAAEIVAHAAPDGYTLLNGNNSILATNAALYKKVNYDPVADFAPISLIGSQASILVVNPDLPVHSMAELIALAK